MKKLAIVTSHPIQYNAPLFVLLTEGKKLQLRVFYTWHQTQQGEKFDPGFQRMVSWDLPLLQGYEYTFVENVSQKPGTHHFTGLDNPLLNAQIEAWQPDALLIFGWSFKSHFKCLRYFKGKIPLIFRGDSTLIDEAGKIKKFVRRFFLSWVYSHIDIALYTGSCNKAYYLACGLKPEQLKYAPHAVDNARFSEPDAVYQQQALEMRNSFGIAPDDVVLLFAGKLEFKKNPFFLLEFMKIHQQPKLKLLIAGNGKLEQQLKLEAGNDGRIYFLGFQNQQKMPVVYRLGDIFILPSVGPGETWGLALNEAMASGRAVASTLKAGATVDLIEPGLNGEIVDFKENRRFSKLIESALKDKSILYKMGEQSRKIVQGFNYQKTISAIYESLDIK